MNNYRYLLDTRILSDMVRNPRGMVGARIAQVGEPAVCTSIIVSSELLAGALKGSAKLTDRVVQVLSHMDVLALEEPVIYHYATIRRHLRHIGQPIGYNDLFIAAHALALNTTLVTDNPTEFQRIPDLKTENWLITQA